MKHVSLLICSLLVLLHTAFAQSGQVVNVADFGATSGDGSDATQAVRLALEACKRTKAKKLVFPKGRYDFWPDQALEKYLFISNNDEGLKRIIFPLDGFENFEVDGQGAQFVFHGYVCPFVLENTKNIVLKNFSMDWERTFHSEGNITAVYPDSLDLAFTPSFPYKIKDNLISFQDKAGVVYPYKSLLEFDAQKRETAFKAWDYWTGPNIRVRELGPGKVRIFVPKIKATVGNVMVFAPSHRLCPGITISDSRNVTVQDAQLYHSGGMGIIAQRSANLEVNRVQVTPAPESGRIISLTADATHFSNCTGTIKLLNCLFENQKDDATNVHGIYAQVTRKPSAKEIEVKLKHEQQYGFDFIVPGQTLEFVHGTSLNTYHTAKVKAVQRLNKEYSRVTFDQDLPKELTLGDAVASTHVNPEVIIKNCIIRNNRARGILLGSRGKTLIEGNTFHAPGAAILFEGDARFWFEQAGVRDVVIRKNVFDNCNFGVWGNAAIQVGSGIEEVEKAGSRYNQGIVIEDNTFRIFDPRILHLYSVEDLVFRRNKIEVSNTYPNQFPNGKAFDVTHSSNIRIEEVKFPVAKGE